MSLSRLFTLRNLLFAIIILNIVPNQANADSSMKYGDEYKSDEILGLTDTAGRYIRLSDPSPYEEAFAVYEYSLPTTATDRRFFMFFIEQRMGGWMQKEGEFIAGDGITLNGK